MRGPALMMDLVRLMILLSLSLSLSLLVVPGCAGSRPTPAGGDSGSGPADARPREASSWWPADSGADSGIWFRPEAGVTCNTACDDGNPCTVDRCVSGSCTHTALDCDDSDPCTTDSCNAGTCLNAPRSCDDSDPCTLDSCHSGACVNKSLDCNDGDACTIDSCAGGACKNAPRDCDDGDDCTTDSCQGGACQHSPAGQRIYRYFNPGTGAHAFFTSSTTPAGFIAEGAPFRTLPTAAPGTKVIYQQVGPHGDHMLSDSPTEGAACCGYVNDGDIGHGFSSAGKGRIPIYRLSRPSPTLLHLSSGSPDEGVACCGYTLEFVHFHACPP